MQRAYIKAYGGMPKLKKREEKIIMATVKMSTVGATKSLEVWLRFNKRCFNCNVELTFQEYQIDHIIPRQRFIETGKAVDNSASNLSCLCKSCNSQKSELDATEFYGSEKFAELQKIVNVKLQKSFVFEQGEKLAMSNPSGKFARLFRDGMFWEPTY